MKHLLFASLFLLFSCKIMAQSGFRFTGIGLALNYNTGLYYINSNNFLNSIDPKLNMGLSVYYNGIYPIKNTNLFFNSGTKLRMNIVEPNFIPTQRLGLGIKKIKNENEMTYFTFGGELNAFGNGLYANFNSIIKGKKKYVVISTEISYMNYNVYGNKPIIMASLGVATGWNKKELSETNTKYSKVNHFNADLAIGSINNIVTKDAFGGKFTDYLHVSAGYLLLPKQIISPEVGLGFIAKYNNYEFTKFYTPPQHHYIKSLDYILYAKIGFSLQTDGKVSFIAGSSAFKMLSLKGGGYTLKAGIKYMISEKIGISLCPELVYYSGFSWGWNTNMHTNGNVIQKKYKGLHSSELNTPIVGMKFGVHF